MTPIEMSNWFYAAISACCSPWVQVLAVVHSAHQSISALATHPTLRVAVTLTLLALPAYTEAPVCDKSCGRVTSENHLKPFTFIRALSQKLSPGQG
jgi:hypothetical protein